jgi:glycosyltransferase involved in cell wall biosynthesis
MTGVPIATLGSAWGTREVPHLIEDGVTGFVSDNIHTLRDKVIRCLDDPTYAREIGQAGREKAIEIFGIDTIKQQ